MRVVVMLAPSPEIRVAQLRKQAARPVPVPVPVAAAGRLLVDLSCGKARAWPVHSRLAPVGSVMGRLHQRACSLARPSNKQQHLLLLQHLLVNKLVKPDR